MPPHNPESPYIIQAADLRVHFPLRRKNLFEKRQHVHAVDGVDIRVPQGSAFGIVGESGSGKTTAALAMIRLAPITDGRIFFRDRDITEVTGHELKKLRRHMQVVFQDPYSSLNPRLRAGEIVREPLDRMNVLEKKDRHERAEALFDQVGLRRDQMSLFPHQFSGGQRQRIGVARALASQPDLLVLDEPVSALDVAIQAQLLNLFRDLKDKFALTYLFISHDLGVVHHMCDRIAVMYLGVIVETASRRSLFREPMNPYTRALLKAVPSLKGELRSVPLSPAGAEQATAIDPAPGCRFAPRCPEAMPICRESQPRLIEAAPDHWVACHLFQKPAA
jgi:peptide/nickel transport system ATP-binding protein